MLFKKESILRHNYIEFEINGKQCIIYEQLEFYYYLCKNINKLGNLNISLYLLDKIKYVNNYNEVINFILY